MVGENAGDSVTWTLHGPVLDEPLARTGLFFTPNHLGSTTTLTDATGTVVQSYAYSPFGETTPANGTVANPFQFTGRENEENSLGLYFYRNRYYAPQWGRFISEDPIGFDGGVNWYAYAGNSPLNVVDPLGLDWEDNIRYGLPGLSAVAGAAAGALLEGTGGGLGGTVFGPGGTIAGAGVGVVKGVIDGAALGSAIGYVAAEGIIQTGRAIGDLLQFAKRDNRPCGPSGKPMIHRVRHSTQNAAREAAQHAGQGKPAHHPNPMRGSPHYHPTDSEGDIIKDGTHYEYPR